MTQAAPEAAPQEAADPERAAAGPGLCTRRGRVAEGVVWRPRLLTRRPSAVCLSLAAGAMAAGADPAAEALAARSAPSWCEPGARSRAPGRSLRSVPRGTRPGVGGPGAASGLKDLELI